MTRSRPSGRTRLLAARGRRALTEPVLEATRHVLHVAHAARARGAAALRLHRPVVLPHPRGGVAAARALLLGDVVRVLAAPHAELVRLAVVGTLRGRALGH